MQTRVTHTLVVPDEQTGSRLDAALAQLLPDYSRTQLQDWIKQGLVKVDGKSAKTRDRVLGGETIQIDAELKAQPQYTAEDIALNIIHEDEDILIINKAVGMVVHPAAGNYSSTLLNALLHHSPELQALPRAGIIHRLDKDTSGLLVIAKNTSALQHLSQQLKERTISRIYQTVVIGGFASGGSVDAPIGRHAMQRKRMAITESGRPSRTHYRVMERYRAHTRLKVELETGRTHQIRVHMAHIHHPIVGDPVYGGRLVLPKGASAPLVEFLRGFKRQALHAYELGLVHPSTGEELSFKAPLPEDMKTLIQVLRTDTELLQEND